jgi:MFS family permease
VATLEGARVGRAPGRRSPEAALTAAVTPDPHAPTARDPRTGKPWLPWLVWGVAVAAYVLAVFNRSSLGVAGLQAQHRFHASSTELSLFSVLQLAVYAGMQIPVGVLLDRFGSRRLIVTGGLLMAAGQVTLGVAHTVPMAVFARVLVGAGDAMTFISVLRLVATWFTGGAIPVVTQLTGILGQLGQLAAAYPLVALLHTAQWTMSFVIAAALTTTTAVIALVGVREAPAARAAEPRAARVRATLVEAWHEPGTRLGLWTHFVTQFPGTVFALLWGYPFLVAGEKRSPATAGLLLSVMVIVTMCIGPLLGRIVGRWPLRRSIPVLASVGASVAAWTVVLAWPGRAPLLLLGLLVVVMGSNGPTSMVGFDYARTFNPASRVGSASGIVNVGGFVASLVTILLIGVILSALNPGSGPASLNDFRAAFTVQYLIWAVGLAGVLYHRRVVRRRLAEEEGVVVDPFPHAVARHVRARRTAHTHR